jgi:hypothetical protein
MLARRGEAGSQPADAAMARHFEVHLARLREWLHGRRGFSTRYLRYDRIVAAPAAAADDLARFLEADLDRAAMAASVDARLYRQRGGE